MDMESRLLRIRVWEMKKAMSSFKYTIDNDEFELVGTQIACCRLPIGFQLFYCDLQYGDLLMF